MEEVKYKVLIVDENEEQIDDFKNFIESLSNDIAVWGIAALADESEFPFSKGKLVAKHSSQQQLRHLKSVEGITVNKVHGNEKSVAKLLKHITAKVETMEGAAFLMVCQKEKIPALQLRAISNYVELRNKENWNIALALKNLHDVVFVVLNQLPI